MNSCQSFNDTFYCALQQSSISRILWSCSVYIFFHGGSMLYDPEVGSDISSWTRVLWWSTNLQSRARRNVALACSTHVEITGVPRYLLWVLQMPETRTSVFFILDVWKHSSQCILECRKCFKLRPCLICNGFSITYSSAMHVIHTKTTLLSGTSLWYRMAPINLGCLAERLGLPMHQYYIYPKYHCHQCWTWKSLPLLIQLKTFPDSYIKSVSGCFNWFHCNSHFTYKWIIAVWKWVNIIQ